MGRVALSILVDGIDSVEETVRPFPFRVGEPCGLVATNAYNVIYREPSNKPGRLPAPLTVRRSPRIDSKTYQRLGCDVSPPAD